MFRMHAPSEVLRILLFLVCDVLSMHASLYVATSGYLTFAQHFAVCSMDYKPFQISGLVRVHD